MKCPHDGEHCISRFCRRKECFLRLASDPNIDGRELALLYAEFWREGHEFADSEEGIAIGRMIESVMRALIGPKPR